MTAAALAIAAGIAGYIAGHRKRKREQADLAALRALAELPNSPPDPAASEAPVGASSLSDSASPERSGGAAFLPGWDGSPLRSIAAALGLSAVAWAGLIWAVVT